MKYLKRNITFERLKLILETLNEKVVPEIRVLFNEKEKYFLVYTKSIEYKIKCGQINLMTKIDCDEIKKYLLEEANLNVLYIGFKEKE